MMNAAFAALALDGVYLAFPVEADGDFRRVVQGVSLVGAYGLNVTMPHKTAALEVASIAEDSAVQSRAANTLTFKGGAIIASNTDIDGIIAAMESTGGFRGRHVLILGAGGAGRAGLVAAITQHAERVVLANRRPERATEAISQVEKGMTVLEVLQLDAVDAKVIAAADVIINATSVGMSPTSAECPVEVGALEGIDAESIVLDLVYEPQETVLLGEARERGAHVIGGVEVLLRQGARAFELWTGIKAPLEVMRDALFGKEADGEEILPREDTPECRSDR